MPWAPLHLWVRVPLSRNRLKPAELATSVIRTKAGGRADRKAPEMEYGLFQALFVRLHPAYAGVTGVETRATPAVAGGFWRRHLDPEMERGRAPMRVACAGVSGASRHTPSARFAPD